MTSTTGTTGWTTSAPRVGDVARRSRTVGAHDIARFTDLSGDRNPLHYDEELAALVLRLVAGKKAGHGIDDPSFLQPQRPMSAIGG